MRACPTCGEPGIREHSVLVDGGALAARAAGDELAAYTRCTRCRAVFRCDGPDRLEPQPNDVLVGPTYWLVPPWKAASDPASFQFSWDVIEAFFEQQADEIEWVRPMRGLCVELRDAGYDTRLRAGQSLSTLVLSRSREHGLRPGQSALSLMPQPDRSIAVQGSIAGDDVRLGPLEARLTGELRTLIERLCAEAID